ncbi:killer toxin subunits alpha/beta [Nemania sp. NC0429]|nr:killer toxin subunits alpha/beta [Nemania sp. NC0429]
MVSNMGPNPSTRSLWAICLATLLASQAFAQEFLSQLKPCPQACAPDSTPISWTYYHDLSRLSICPEPILFDFNIKTPLDDPNTDVTLRACTTRNADTNVNALSLVERETPAVCKEPVQSSVTAEFMLSGTASAEDSGNAAVIVKDLQDYLSRPSNCDQSVILGYAEGVVVGVYSGDRVGNKAAADNLVQQVLEKAKANKIGSHTTLEVCGEGRSGPNVFGIVIDTTGDFVGVQETLSSWSDGNCTNEAKADESESWENTPFWTVADETVNHGFLSMRSLQVRANCRTIKVESGNGCGELAKRCGISAADFTKYNPGSTLCSTLKVGQAVCCSSGSLPDIRPKPSPDGTCATHVVASGEYCDLIAGSNGLTLKDLDTFNNKTTWGWSGCGNLQVGLKICLSKGNPPLPNSVADAECGPTKPGTKLPTGSYNISTLNPCPLNVCCNIWGHCGTTADFCTISKSATGNPGTSAPGKNGCVSNCETGVVNNANAPASFMKIGYFEAWNLNRTCLRMDVRRADPSYTHLHFAFAEITTDFKVSIGAETKDQFAAFKGMKTNSKKVLAFGGWSFSTDADSFPIFRSAVTTANRQTFANNVVKFAKDNGLNGLDFDWEYPGAPDIPGVPPGDKGDGDRYLEFLQLVKAQLPAGMTLSIAAPASYWYLKGFPIQKISTIVDYIIYMTYDIHGQWDAQSPFAADGCPQGSCLRSHVNYTETYNALAMITKAGVPSTKIVVGVSSYGRSFKMAKEGCTGPNCLFLGGPTSSQAKPGSCTGEAGYLANAEIHEVATITAGSTHWWDQSSDTDFVVYQKTEWVAYMTETTKQRRVDKYKQLHFAGTSDWAIDLKEFLPGGDSPDAPSGGDWDEDIAYCGDKYTSLDEIEQYADSIPDYCAAVYVLPILRDIATESLTKYQAILNDGYDRKFTVYAEVVAKQAGEAVRNYITEHGNDNLECQIVEAVSCQRICEDKNGAGSDICQWSTLDQCSEITGPWVGSGYGPLKYINTTQPCPPDYSKRGIIDHDLQTVYWSLPGDNADAFWSDLFDKTGISEDDINWVDEWGPSHTSDKSCDPVYVPVVPESCYYTGWWFNEPAAFGFQPEDVTNPKEVVSKALDKLEGLDREIDIALAKIKLGQWAAPNDLVDALSIPVLMVRQAVESMEQVKEEAEKIIEAERKALISLFLGAVLFIVPAVGETLAAAGLASLGRIIALLGEAGGVAQGIYDIVNDPSSAPLAIFDIVLGAAGIRDAAAIGKAAKYRNDFRPNDGILGDVVKTDLDKISKVIKNVCSK